MTTPVKHTARVENSQAARSSYGLRHCLRHTVAFVMTSALLGSIAVAAEEQPSSMGNDPLANAQQSFEHPVKYAIYSPAWHLSTNAGLRIVAQNHSDEAIELKKVVFTDESGEEPPSELLLNLTVPAHGWAETQVDYQELLAGNDCVERTMEDDWKLVEISNYTLNPSVRGLIIENTRSFRIYQCVRSVRAHWHNIDQDISGEGPQWLMYHFERLPID